MKSSKGHGGMGGGELSEHLAALDRIITAEAEVYQRLLIELGKQRRFAVEARVGALVESVQVKEALLVNLGRLEKERLQMMDGLAEKLQISPDELTASRLIALSPGEAAERLNACRHRLRAVIEQVKVDNQTNRDLFRRLLELTQKTLDVLGGKTPGERTYRENGRMQGEKRTGTMLHGEI